MSHVEHIGLAVDDIEAVVETFRDLFGREPYKAEAVTSQKVRTHFLDGGTTKLELLESLDEDSPVQRFLNRQGEGLHHLAFEVPDLEATLRRLRDAGFKLLNETPQPGADDKNIAFVHPKQTHGVLVEFCESVVPSWSPVKVPRHDGHLSVFERGPHDRPSLLVLHGAAGCTLHETAPLMRRLESTFHLVGIDLSGHGASAFPGEHAFSLDLFAEDVHTAIEALDLGSAHVFGFSLGGGVALHLARAYPGLVDRLALFQTNVQWTTDQAEQMKEHLDLDRIRAKSSERAERLQSMHEDSPLLLQRLRSFVEALPERSRAFYTELSNISAPTLVGSVDRDPLFGVDTPRRIQRQLPNARLAILPGDRHSLTDAPLSHLVPLLTRHFLDE